MPYLLNRKEKKYNITKKYNMKSLKTTKLKIKVGSTETSFSMELSLMRTMISQKESNPQ